MKKAMKAMIAAAAMAATAGAARSADRVNLWPLGYYDGESGSIAWPLVTWSGDHFALNPVYSQHRRHGGEWDEFNFLYPFVQADVHNGRYRAFPFFWGRESGGDAYFCLFPALWWNDDFAGAFPFFWSRGSCGYGFAVFPVFWYQSTNYVAWHTLFPAWYWERNEDGVNFWAACGLAGYWRECATVPATHWLLPLYVKQGDEFASIPYSRIANGKHGAKHRYLCGIGGFDTAARDGAYSASWLFPLYHHEARRDFLSVPYSWSGGGTASTNECWAAGLAGRRTGATEGGWLFPLFDRRSDVDFAAKAAAVEADELPPEINASKDFHVRDETTYLLASDDDASVSGRRRWDAATNAAYRITRTRRVGNGLVFRRSKTRTATFDNATRAKKADVEQTKATLLGGVLYGHEGEANLRSGSRTRRDRILWKLWDRREKDGDVSIDAFPGLVCDYRRDGRSKTALLWRLFRCERDPAGGATAVDFMFLPVWR